MKNETLRRFDEEQDVWQDIWWKTRRLERQFLKKQDVLMKIKTFSKTISLKTRRFDEK